MRRCEATTRAGKRCLHHAVAGGDFCAVHKDEVSGGGFLAGLAGAVIGNAIAPGLGGLIAGSLAGTALRQWSRDSTAKAKRVFISFDFENDRELKDFVIGQSRLHQAPFDFSDHSLKEAAPEKSWEKKARVAIRRSDLVLVVVGRHTHRAHGVIKEVAMARDAGIKIVQMIGRKDVVCKPVADAGRLYSWSWDNLQRLMA